MFKKTSAHWGSLRKSNRRLYELALERSLQKYSHLADIVRDSPKALECRFGNKRFEITVGEINYEVETLFGWGYCNLLALALHDLTNLPLALFSKNPMDEPWLGHAAVRLGQDKYLDIRGIRTKESITTVYRTGYEYSLDRSEYCSKIASAEHEKDPFLFIDELEKELTFDFARLILKKNSKELGAKYV